MPGPPEAQGDQSWRKSQSPEGVRRREGTASECYEMGARDPRLLQESRHSKERVLKAVALPRGLEGAGFVPTLGRHQWSSGPVAAPLSAGTPSPSASWEQMRP